MADEGQLNGDFRSSSPHFWEIIPVATCVEQTMIRVAGAAIDADDKANEHEVNIHCRCQMKYC